MCLFMGESCGDLGRLEIGRVAVLLRLLLSRILENKIVACGNDDILLSVSLRSFIYMYL